LRTLDASSIIYAWDNYPSEQFPPLWRWLAEEIDAGDLSIPQVAFEEVERRLPECAEWLRSADVKRIATSNRIVHEAFRIKALLKIEGDSYHAKGVGENDLLIVATAKVENLELVSNEGRQTQFPSVPAKAKIPAVCGLDSVDVDCIDFITLIKRSGTVFEGRAR